MAGRLAGKIAVITGAASGIGLATTERFVAEGAKVVAGDVQDAKGAALEARFAGQLVYQTCDVTDEEAIKALLARADDEFSGLDILFNNAGAVGTTAPLDELDMGGFDGTIALLLRSVICGMRHAVPLMKARGGGAIVNTASVASFSAGWAPFSYSVAKGAVLHASKLAAAELGRHAIRVNAVCPGLIATSIFGAAMGASREQADQMAALVAMRAGGAQPLKGNAPEDVANAVLYLASDEARFVSGAHILVDGAMLSGPRHSWDPSDPGVLGRLFDLSAEQVAQFGRRP